MTDETIVEDFYAVLGELMESSAGFVGPNLSVLAPLAVDIQRNKILREGLGDLYDILDGIKYTLEYH